jgi:hypothetical protein
MAFEFAQANEHFAAYGKHGAERITWDYSGGFE